MKLVDEAESLLLYQFKDAPRLRGLVRSLIMSLQFIADDIAALSDGIHIDTASGNLLDILGRIVGQPRSGMSDDDFKTWLKIRIKLNRCNGTPEELLTILELLLGKNYSITLTEYQPNDAVFVLFDALSISPETVFSLIKTASSPGLRHHFIDANKANPFRLDNSTFSSSQFAEFFRRGNA